MQASGQARAGEGIEARLVRELELVEARIAARAEAIDAGGGHWSSGDYEDDDYDLGVADGLRQALRIVRGD